MTESLHYFLRVIIVLATVRILQKHTRLYLPENPSYLLSKITQLFTYKEKEYILEIFFLSAFASFHSDPPLLHSITRNTISLANWFLGKFHQWLVLIRIRNRRTGEARVMPSLLLGLSSSCHQTALLSTLLAHTGWLRLLAFGDTSTF